MKSILVQLLIYVLPDELRRFRIDTELGYPRPYTDSQCETAGSRKTVNLVFRVKYEPLKLPVLTLSGLNLVLESVNLTPQFLYFLF
jgi:hypothetical protein